MHRWIKMCFIVAMLTGRSVLPAAAAESPHSLAKPSSDKSKFSVDPKASDLPFRRMATKPIEDNPKLPRVLLLGDSIAMGYTIPLRELLKDKANVHFPHENCHTSRQILEQLEVYLGDEPWDVIHFNCGIHDITRLNAAGKPVKSGEKGEVRVPEEEYRTNLEKIIARLRKTGAELVWCTSTPVDDIFPHRNPKDIERYNEVAKEVMEKHGIPATDLHRQVSKDGKPKWTDGGHFTVEGSRENAATVAPAIEAALKKRAQSK